MQKEEMAFSIIYDGWKIEVGKQRESTRYTKIEKTQHRTIKSKVVQKYLKIINSAKIIKLKQEEG